MISTALPSQVPLLPLPLRSFGSPPPHVCRATSSPSFSTCLTSISPSRRIVWTSLGWAGGVFRASVSCQVVANAIVVLSPAPDGFFHSTSPPLLAAAQRAVVLGGVEREGVADTHLPRCVPPPHPPTPRFTLPHGPRQLGSRRAKPGFNAGDSGGFRRTSRGRRLVTSGGSAALSLRAKPRAPRIHP